MARRETLPEVIPQAEPVIPVIRRAISQEILPEVMRPVVPVIPAEAVIQVHLAEDLMLGRLVERQMAREDRAMLGRRVMVEERFSSRYS